ncbi:MAG: hypothetical protein PHZ04_01300 [Patescibacteria group bacterium]|nr:hypothetical protein [Patescibacteria group bacterium]MDD5294626.1 hypothetical protein [Patescibacteria group bacterium]MDD5554386.1 hypothetical protein [Patescibacteria group bacterium]
MKKLIEATSIFYSLSVLIAFGLVFFNEAAAGCVIGVAAISAMATIAALKIHDKLEAKVMGLYF